MNNRSFTSSTDRMSYQFLFDGWNSCLGNEHEHEHGALVRARALCWHLCIILSDRTQILSGSPVALKKRSVVDRVGIIMNSVYDLFQESLSLILPKEWEVTFLIRVCIDKINFGSKYKGHRSEWSVLWLNGDLYSKCLDVCVKKSMLNRVIMFHQIKWMQQKDRWTKRFQNIRYHFSFANQQR